MKKALALAVVVSLACALLLAGCAGRGTLSSDISDETGAYIVKANDAGKDAAVSMLGGGFTVEEGRILVISPDLTKGSLQVRLLDASNNEVFNEKISGRVLSTYDFAPGEYSISVTCNENGTTGSLVAVAVDAAEFEQQNQDLDSILGNVGISK